MEWISIATLFGIFFLLMFLSVPVSFSIGLATIATIFLNMPFDQTTFVIAQKMITGLDSFTLLALPCFVLAGNIMNHGGIAKRLIHFALAIAGGLPGSLLHVNVIANMLFGAISGSAIASAAAVGGTMTPMQNKQGYDPGLSAAVNIASCPTGLLIPPSTTLIVYALISGGTSIAALFVAGYIPGILMGIAVMISIAIIGRKKTLPRQPKQTWSTFFRAFLDALLPLSLVIVIIGGIIAGIFTATEASAIAVVYALVLSMLIYREIQLKDLPQIILHAMVTSAIVLLLIGTSIGMSWAMAYADIPYLVNDAIRNISENKYIILLLINLILLAVGLFMDMTPALLIFTPIFLPIATDLGMDPVHFGIMMTMNLCIGIVTPPVGSAIFVGCSVSNIRMTQVIPYLSKIYLALIVALLLVVYLPALSLWLPSLLLNYGA